MAGQVTGGVKLKAKGKAAKAVGKEPGNKKGALTNTLSDEPLAKLQWCDEFSTGMSGKRGVRGVLG